MSSKDPNHLVSLLKMKCPCCRKGDMFTQKSMFPLKNLLDMPERCAVCGQKMELQVGFYYGTGYVSYALSVGLIAICFIAYWLVLGLSHEDNSILYALAFSVVVTLLLQPWLMRMSRVIYLDMFVKYDPEAAKKGSTKPTTKE